jgi:hypothetical protein
MDIVSKIVKDFKMRVRQMPFHHALLLKPCDAALGTRQH